MPKPDPKPQSELELELPGVPSIRLHNNANFALELICIRASDSIRQHPKAAFDSKMSETHVMLLITSLPALKPKADESGSESAPIEDRTASHRQGGTHLCRFPRSDRNSRHMKLPCELGACRWSSLLKSVVLPAPPPLNKKLPG
ncbi:Hypothetical predicted protein [Drosophila guanche]|uniref:Uncharacterized protein n=1 Tax=Drosophila guanche TaxID=7266 RepID=A0A3B0J7K1_DROGU|nr:Hypothetical predicted protein [Drosophila guanche]